MWDRIGSVFDGFTEGGGWGAYIGMAAGALIGLASPAAAAGAGIEAAFMGALMYGVIGATAGAGLGSLKNLIFGGGEEDAEVAEGEDAPDEEPEEEVAVQQEVEEPSHGLLSWLGIGDGNKAAGRGV